MAPPKNIQINDEAIRKGPKGRISLRVFFFKAIKVKAIIEPDTYAKISAKIDSFHPKTKPKSNPSFISPPPTHFPLDIAYWKKKKPEKIKAPRRLDKSG